MSERSSGLLKVKFDSKSRLPSRWCGKTTGLFPGNEKRRYETVLTPLTLHNELRKSITEIRSMFRRGVVVAVFGFGFGFTVSLRLATPRSVSG
jgi:hypothetical protein